MPRSELLLLFGAFELLNEPANYGSFFSFLKEASTERRGGVFGPGCRMRRGARVERKRLWSGRLGARDKIEAVPLNSGEVNNTSRHRVCGYELGV